MIYVSDHAELNPEKTHGLVKSYESILISEKDFTEMIYDCDHVEWSIVNKDVLCWLIDLFLGDNVGLSYGHKSCCFNIERDTIIILEEMADCIGIKRVIPVMSFTKSNAIAGTRVTQ